MIFVLKETLKELSLDGYKITQMYDMERDSYFIKLETFRAGNENKYFSEVRELDSKILQENRPTVDFYLNQILKEMFRKMERKLALDSISKKGD